MDAFIRQIADEVIRRLADKPKTALVVFSGAAIGFSQELERRSRSLPTKL